MANLIEVVIRAADNASSVLKTVSGSLDGMGSTATRVGAQLTAITAPLAAFGALALKQASDQQTALAQLESVLKSTGGAAGVTTEMADDLANSLSKVTRFADDAVLGAENLLLTFTSIGKDVFPDTIKTVLDMSTALGQDLKSSAIQLGKALQDPITGVTALRRVGVNFSDAQMDMIKSLVESNDLLGAQTLILKELQKEFGGSAEAAGRTFAGQLDRLNNKFGELQEKIGFILMPTLERVVGFLDRTIDRVTAWADANPVLTQTIVALGAALVALGPALIIIGQTLSGLSAISAALSTGGILAGLAPALPVIAAVVAALAGLKLAYDNNFLGFKTTVDNAIDAIKAALPLIPFYVEYHLGKIWSRVQPLLQPILDWFSGTGENSLGGAVQAVGTWIEQNVVAPLRGIWALVEPEIQKVVTWFNTDFRTALDLVLGTINDLKNGFLNFWNDIQPALQPIVDGLKAIFQPVIDIINEVLDSWEILRRLGSGTPLRTLPGEIAPGVVDPRTIHRLTENTGSKTTTIPATIANALNALAAGMTEVADSIDTGAKKIGKTAIEAARKLGGDSAEASTVTQRAFDGIGYQMRLATSGFAAAIANSTPSATTALAVSGQGIGAALGGFSVNLLTASAQAIANMQMVGQQIGAAIAGLFGGSAGGQNQIGTAFTDPQVVADRIAAIAEAYRRYNAQSHDYAGSYRAGVPYVVSPSAAPEVFIPSTSGYAIPNANLGGRDVRIGTLQVVLPGVTDLSDPRQLDQLAEAIAERIGL